MSRREPSCPTRDRYDRAVKKATEQPAKGPVPSPTKGVGTQPPEVNPVEEGAKGGEDKSDSDKKRVLF